MSSVLQKSSKIHFCTNAKIRHHVLDDFQSGLWSKSILLNKRNGDQLHSSFFISEQVPHTKHSHNRKEVT